MGHIRVHETGESGGGLRRPHGAGKDEVTGADESVDALVVAGKDGQADACRHVPLANRPVHTPARHDANEIFSSFIDATVRSFPARRAAELRELTLEKIIWTRLTVTGARTWAQDKGQVLGQGLDLQGQGQGLEQI